MKKEVKGKKITIDALAIMMNSGFEGMEKRMIDVIKEEMGNVREEIGNVKKEVEGVKNQLAGTNKRIDDLVTNRVKYEEHNKLKARVDVIEKKLTPAPMPK